MEMTEGRTEDAWDRLSRRLFADTDAGDDEVDGGEDESGEERNVLSRVNGWSLLLAVIANVLLLLLVLVTGATMIGLVACGAIGLTSWLLVVAEILSVRRL